jgi:indoleacetamide hydrolase
MVPLELTLIEAAAALRTRQLGHLEYVQALLAQTDRLSTLNAWIRRDPERLIAQAKALDQVRPEYQKTLAGIPIAIKDNIDTTDLPTSGGTWALLATKPKRNAAVVDALLQAGALIAGRTNLHEFEEGPRRLLQSHALTRKPIGAKQTSPHGLGPILSLFQRTLILAVCRSAH